ncbi:MAG: HAD family phosphatase [Treponemataceae bacterium]
MGIKAVAFDFGNVISERQDPSTMGLLAAIADVSEEQARDIVFTGREDWDRGDLSGPDHYRRGFQRHGVEIDEGVLHAFMRADLESWATLNEACVALMEEVKAAGTRTAILSNMPHEFLGSARKRFPVVSKVDVSVFSCEHSIVKPVKAIYEVLLNQLNVPASEVLFFDDMPENIDAAREVGIQAHLWSDAAAARKILHESGVLK